jgi:hypothetical protein
MFNQIHVLMTYLTSWRVTEQSQILLVLMDSRCPTLHFPDSLASYLEGKKVILVLTKVDISGHERTEAWVHYFRLHYPKYPIVPVDSYLEKERTYNQQGTTLFKPGIAQTFRDRLVDAIRTGHADLASPPKHVVQNMSGISSWRAPVPLNIDWSLLSHSNAKLYSESEHACGNDLGDLDDRPGYLTVGLIGRSYVSFSCMLKTSQVNRTSVNHHCSMHCSVKVESARLKRQERFVSPLALKHSRISAVFIFGNID